MDANRFDAILRSLASSPSRRGALRLLAGSALGGILAGIESSKAKKRKKKKVTICRNNVTIRVKKKRKGKHLQPGDTPGACTTTTTTTPPPSCFDGVMNFAETDIDCGGGTCPRCADGKKCVGANDCISGTCAAGVCVPCTPSQLCGSDANGTCRCDQSFPSNIPVCDTSQQLGLTVNDCSKCPPGTETCVTINGLLFNCYKRCGSA